MIKNLPSDTSNSLFRTFILILFILISFPGCERFRPERLILVETNLVSDITRFSCSLSGTIYDTGENGVEQYGFCWSETEDPSQALFCSTLGARAKAGGFDGELHDLPPGTRINVWAYAEGSGERVYGKRLSFQTFPLDLPVLETKEVSDITSHSARSGGFITDDGGTPVLSRGICWSQSPSPGLTGFFTVDGTGEGEYTSFLDELAPGTQYYVRSYATNSVGTGYGNEHSFYTLDATSVPTVATVEVNNITPTEAFCGGIIQNDGGEPVTAKGVCWSETEGPTLTDYFTVDGNGNASYESHMTDLTPDRVYFVRAYATNSNGTAYGNQQAFRTAFPCGSALIDSRDGKSYLTVQIGEQCWMAENLNVGTRIDGDQPQTNNEVLEKYCYLNDNANCDVYGGIYQWNEMMQYTQVEMVRGVCPDGWHIPSDLEWKILEMQLGMIQEQADAAGWRGTDEGGKLKAVGTTFWDAPNEGATNASLFTALPAGGTDDMGNFGGLGYFTDYWTSTTLVTQSMYRYLDADEARIQRADGNRNFGTSVRCVKD